ncbi:hypothetical protein [Chryseobacterium luteum]|uniref:Uncharacterized protein n=1 Tax=Chryseobacterium luteum TaxID=421531 RepID=A0A085ZUI6_9FLAO|nr:hypothetical protein [Chryseobacterium luteum]KFF08100.1 hypothetical protein IX38_08130 [Chryseobacterium luteum]
MKKIIWLFLICWNLTYSQNIEFKYEYRVCYQSKLVEERLYNSKTGIYEEIFYDRNTFIDTTNIEKESFKAYIPLNFIQKKEISDLYFKTKLKKNTLLYSLYKNEDYNTTSVYIYDDQELINSDNQYIKDKKETEYFGNLTHTLLSFIKSSDEYNRVFYWYNIKK